MKIDFIDSINDISAIDWQRLNTSSSPFLTYDFFKAIEVSGSASKAKGWQPHHMQISDNTNVEAILPLYIKHNSWGEYVFDWGWAEAYQNNGLPYYPKLVGTLPFTPVTSDKLISTTFSYNDAFALLSGHCQQHSFHSWHLLFCPRVKEIPDDVYLRHTVQFHWFNRNYYDFEDFISTFTSRKRKNTRKERLSIAEQGISIRQIKGVDITPKDLTFFYLTYQLTYLKKGHQPHLSIQFFQNIIASMADNILLIIASNQDEDLACSWFFYDNEQLYGRYWGCTQYVNNLHFELCYYQGIEFCIKHKLGSFNPGTQGEHKIQRGFEPILTNSYHWVQHPSFRNAVKDFCQQERHQTKNYLSQCQQALPYKNFEELLSRSTV